MTNVYASPEKAPLRDFLFQVAERGLRNQGWSVERVPGAGKPSLRRITKEGTSRLVSIRTSQDTWIAFPRTADDAGWATLDEVDYVVAASVDDYDRPRFANIHLVPGDDMRARFDRAYAARKAAGHVIPVGRGVWLSLYEAEANNPVASVGGGIGLAYPPIWQEPLPGDGDGNDPTSGSNPPPSPPPSGTAPAAETSSPNSTNQRPRPLTIAEAKRGLALTFGVPEDAIEITIRG